MLNSVLRIRHLLYSELSLQNLDNTAQQALFSHHSHCVDITTNLLVYKETHWLEVADGGGWEPCQSAEARIAVEETLTTMLRSSILSELGHLAYDQSRK